MASTLEETDKLLAVLTPNVKRAMEAARRMCVDRRYSEITAANLLRQLLNEIDGDLQLLLRRSGINAVYWLPKLGHKIAGSPEGRVDQPKLSEELHFWLSEAWRVSTHELQQSQLRSSALLIALARNAKQLGMHTLGGLASLSDDVLLAEYAKITESSAETRLPTLAGTPPGDRDLAETLAGTQPEAAKPDPESWQIPEKLGKYEIRSRVASGSMGTVYLGYDPFINREVAIKVAHVNALSDPSSAELYRKLFFTELQTAGMLNHPNILAVFDAGIDSQHYYIVMEYVEGGRTLREYVAPANLLPVSKVTEVVFKCAKALDYAHRKGVVHRDIKPSNILVTPDLDVKIADFSVAFVQEQESSDQTTKRSGLVGSPRFMSPEQARREPATPRSDLFSLGLVMYELLTGVHAFDARTLKDLIAKIREVSLQPVDTIRPEVPPPICSVLNRLLQKDPEARYESGLALANALNQADSGTSELSEQVAKRQHFEVMSKLDIFKAFSDAQIWEILQAGFWSEYREGDGIVIEGELDDSFYIVIDGQVQVRSGKRMNRLATGDCFGAAGYPGPEKRSVSVLAQTQVTVLKINAAALEQISVACQLQFHKVFLRRLVDRLSTTPEGTGGG